MKVNSTLIKFGNKEHIERLRYDGELYLNNLPYFWNIEGDEVRQDLNDSLKEFQMGNKGRATIKTDEGRDVEIEITKWKFRVPPPNSETINLYCMYALRPFHGSFPVDKRNFNFGSSAFVLLDPDSFIDKIRKTLREKEIDGKANLVEYVSHDYVGQIGFFKKREKFRYQSEWRLVCLNGDGFPRKIILGSLEDISIIIPSEKINSEIRI